MNVSNSRAFFSDEYVFLYCYYEGALLVLLDTTIHLEEVLVWLGQVFVRIARSFGYNAARERDRGAIVDGGLWLPLQTLLGMAFVWSMIS